jgi:serine/threonine protein kinase
MLGAPTFPSLPALTLWHKSPCSRFVRLRTAYADRCGDTLQTVARGHRRLPAKISCQRLPISGGAHRIDELTRFAGRLAMLEAGSWITHYRVIASLGAGGMGEVYRVHDTSLERTVALKILPPDLVCNDERVRRFVREAKAASSLNHPNIMSHEVNTNAATAEAHQTREGVRLCTVAYMSPEQVEGKVADQRSDVFSFGCILYEAATRRRPFDAPSDVDVMHRILHDNPESIDVINPQVPAELRRIIKRCLAKDPERRYQSMKDLAFDLKDIERGVRESLTFRVVGELRVGYTADHRPVASVPARSRCCPLHGGQETQLTHFKKGHISAYASEGKLVSVRFDIQSNAVLIHDFR